MAFKWQERMLRLKGKEYLPVAPRIAWLRDEHPEASITTECTYADEEHGVYRFKATVTVLKKGPHGEYMPVMGVGHGMATRKEFPSGPAEKAETKSLGRAIAFLGYGTLNAQELDEDDAAIMADSPAEPAMPSGAALLAKVQGLLAADAEAEGKLPKKLAEMDEAELTKTASWLARRARVMSS